MLNAIEFLLTVGAAIGADTAIQSTNPTPPSIPAIRSTTAVAAIANGVENVCGWFVRGKDYSLEGAQEVAGRAGFRRGASVTIVPTPEMAAKGAYSSLNFTAEIQPGEPAPAGVTAFMAFHGPLCQVHAYGYQAEAAQYVDSLAKNGWSLIDRTSRNPILVERWVKGAGDDQITLVVNRWVGAGLSADGLGFILNVFAGDNRTSGAFLPPS